MSLPTTGPLPPDLHILAGEYVLGTLSSAQRRDIETRMLHDEALRSAVQSWEARLLPLTGLAQPVSPSPALWQRIEQSLQPDMAQAPARPTPARPARQAASSSRASFGQWIGWNSLALWRTLTAGSVAIAALLAVLLVNRADVTPAAPQFMVVLVAPQDKAPGWVIQANMARQLSLTPLANTAVPQDKSLQFWTKGEGWSGPVSLGLVKPGQTIRIPLDKLPPLQPNQLFELTLEPATGSPINKPTGPIQFIGRAVKVM